MQFRKCFFFVLLLTTNGLFAQDFQLAGINYATFTKTNIKDSPTNQAVKFQEFNAFVKLPIRFRQRNTVLVNTLQYGLVQATAYNSPLFSATETTKNLHNVSLSMTLVQKLNKKWSLIAVAIPTLASDFETSLSGHDFLFQGTLFASAKLNDKWSLGGGALYTAQLGDPRFLPVVQLKYQHNKHFVNVLLPSFVNYLYTLDKQEKWHLGVRLATNGGNFNVNNQDFTQLIPNSIHNILYSRINMGAVLNIRLTKTLVFEASGGLSVARKYNFKDASKKLYNYNSENGQFFNVGLIIRPPLNAIKDNKIAN